MDPYQVRDGLFETYPNRIIPASDHPLLLHLYQHPVTNEFLSTCYGSLQEYLDESGGDEYTEQFLEEAVAAKFKPKPMRGLIAPFSGFTIVYPDDIPHSEFLSELVQSAADKAFQEGGMDIKPRIRRDRKTWMTKRRKERRNKWKRNMFY